jgi:myo-inositol 2-dehydrogenase / D-chiro-inositol 1-dehydrogenase
MLAAGNHHPTEVSWHRAGAISVDPPEAFFLERYRSAYAEEMVHFAAMLRGEAAPRSSIEDGIRALEIADAATRSAKEGRAVAI